MYGQSPLMPRARPLNEVIYWIPKINANSIAVRLADPEMLDASGSTAA